MKYIIKEGLYVIASIASIYSLGYIYFNDDWMCKAWGGIGAVIASVISYNISKWIFRRKNKELKDMAARKAELETMVLGDKRLESGYEPDNYV